MRRVFSWVVAVMLCLTVGVATAEEPEKARLQEAQAAFDEAMKLREAGRYSEALARAEHALAQREAALGGTHPDVATCLSLLGDLFRRQGNLARAEPLLRRSLAIREVAFGKDHPLVANSLSGLALIYQEKGLYAQAEPLYQRALAIRETALGKDALEVARTLDKLANLYRDQGLYDRSEPLSHRALAIFEAVLGRDHPEVAGTLNNLAVLYAQQALYSRAETLFQRFLSIQETAHGRDHLGVALANYNLAAVYTQLGLYSRAEPLLQRSLTIREADLGRDHPLVADSLNILAILYSQQGVYDRAEPLFQRALAIREATLGKDHPLVAVSNNSLGNFYLVQQLYARAEPFFQRALAINEATLGKDHPTTMSEHINLARVYTSQGLYSLAAPLLQHVLAVGGKAFGERHPLVWASLHSLARLHVEQGLYGRAEPLFQRALAIMEATLGKDHPDVAQTLSALASLHLSRQHLTKALPLYTRAFTISEQRLRREALDFSESRLTSFLQYLRADEQSLYALLRAHPGNAPVRRLALGAALLLKGRSVEETADVSRTLYRSLGAEDRNTFERLRGLRTQRAALSLAGPGSLAPAEYQQRLKALADKGDALEADLAKRSAPLRALTALPPLAEVVDRVAAALPQDGALVEFIAYVDSPLVPKPGTPRAKIPGELRYLALVLFPDGSTRALDLGPAAPIDSAATHLRDALANRDAQFQPLAQQLHQLVFQPLRPLLGKARRLFLSPDGQLGLVPFAALHDGRQFLIDSFDFTYLTSGKDLLPRPQEGAPPSSVVVLADPDFKASPAALPQAPENTPSTVECSTALERFFSTSRSDLAEVPWVPLPGTRQEAEAIQRLLPEAQLFLGPEATKERLLRLPTPGILHLATHGFFFEDAPVPTGSRGAVNFGVLGGDSGAPSTPDPLLRSGLVLAGAGTAASDAVNAARISPDTTLATALELAGLDLWGTQLVVLSACDTGRGDVTLGQGVSGLRRAFVVAGAETVVMSLWKVNDGTTSALMEDYYRHLLAGQGRATALRDAMRSFREIHPHPHYWAPFIAVGSDAPLHRMPVPQHSPDSRPEEKR